MSGVGVVETAVGTEGRCPSPSICGSLGPFWPLSTVVLIRLPAEQVELHGRAVARVMNHIGMFAVKPLPHRKGGECGRRRHNTHQLHSHYYQSGNPLFLYFSLYLSPLSSLFSLSLSLSYSLSCHSLSLYVSLSLSLVIHCSQSVSCAVKILWLIDGRTGVF